MNKSVYYIDLVPYTIFHHNQIIICHSVLRNGVVGCIMTIKHIATTENTSSESVYLNESSDKTKKAIQLLGKYDLYLNLTIY